MSTYCSDASRASSNYNNLSFQRVDFQLWLELIWHFTMNLLREWGHHRESQGLVRSVGRHDCR